MKNIIKVIFLSALLCAANQKVIAADYLDMDLNQLLQIKVTGSTLRDESLQTVPSAVTVFTRDQIDQLGFDYLYELLNLVPGYQFNRNGDSPAGYTFSARGRRISSEAREILLLVDGRVFADPRTGSADGSLPLFPLEEIERVEIIRGPGSALYGSNAFNGVLNIVTRTGDNSVKLTAGSQTRRGARINFSNTDGDWETNLLAQLYEDNGEQYSIANNDVSDPRKTANIDFSLGYGETKVRAAYHKIRADDFYVGENIRNNFNYYQQLLKQFSIEQKLTLAEDIKTQVALSYLESRQDFNVMALPENYLANLSQPASGDALLAKAIFAGETYRLALSNDWTINHYSSLQFGADWHSNRETISRGKSNFDLAELAQGSFPITYYGDLTGKVRVGKEELQQAIGFYSQYLRELSATTNLTLGMRYDNYIDIGKHLSPRLGLVKQISDYQSVKLLYGEAFRAPSLSETGLQNNPVLVGNPNLNYEIVKTWDLIWLGNWKSTSLSVDGFLNHYKDPIATGLQGATRTYVNGGHEHSKGVELEASQQVSEQWLMRATYTYLFDLPKSTFREAKNFASLMVNYETHSWNWNVAAVFHGARGELAADGGQDSLESYWFANTKLSYRFNENYAVNLQIKNIFDKEYMTPTQGRNIPNGVPNRGREWSLGVNWTY
ncbi:MAG: TonB-dependent receptor [Pseudomonadota bacterium]